MSLSPRTIVIGLVAVAGLVAGGEALRPARAAEGEVTEWRYPIDRHGPLLFELPDALQETERDDSAHTVQFRPTDWAKFEMSLEVGSSETPDPAFNDPAKLRAWVQWQGEELLDQSVESRVTLHEIRGPQSGGFYFTLRDRSPRKKSEAFVTRGAVGVGDLRLRFTILTPQASTPPLRQALKMIAGSRQGEPPPPEPAASETPARRSKRKPSEPGG
jgi:hypothetical protein